MKSKVWIIIAVLFASIMILAVALYPMLAEKYSAGGSTYDKTSSSDSVKAEDFTVYDADMNEVKLSDKIGKPVIVNFWASWCYPCRSEFPAFNALYEKYKDDVEFMMVNLTDGQRETVSIAKEFAADSGYTFPVYYDIEFDASNTYGVYSIPETLFIAANGEPI